MGEDPSQEEQEEEVEEVVEVLYFTPPVGPLSVSRPFWLCVAREE